MYGPRGHAGSYARPAHSLGLRALRLVLRLYAEEVLSEGQCCKALDLDRVEFRALADAAEPTLGGRNHAQLGPGNASNPSSKDPQ